IRDRDHSEASAVEGSHASAFAAQHGFERHVAERGGDHFVDEVRLAATEIVGKIAHDAVFLGSIANFGGEGFSNAHLFAMTESVGLAVFLRLVSGPARAFGNDEQSVVARGVALFGEEQIYQLLEIHFIFGNATTDRSDIGRVERSESSVAAE